MTSSIANVRFLPDIYIYIYTGQVSILCSKSERAYDVVATRLPTEARPRSCKTAGCCSDLHTYQRGSAAPLVLFAIRMRYVTSSSRLSEGTPVCPPAVGRSVVRGKSESLKEFRHVYTVSGYRFKDSCRRDRISPAAHSLATHAQTPAQLRTRTRTARS